MNEREKAFLQVWANRRCNIGDCSPAFHMTDADYKAAIEASRLARKVGAEKAAETYGVPVGTCKVTGAERVVYSSCNVSDEDFLEFAKKDARGLLGLE